MHSTPPGKEVPPSLLGEVIRLGRAYLTAGADFWGRGWEINARYAQQAVSKAFPGVGAAQQTGDIVSTIANIYKHYVIELAMLPGLAAERFGAELASAARGAGHRAGQTFTREEQSGTFAKDGKSVTLPVSVRDAAHGFAVYTVPAALGQRGLAEDGKYFKVVDLGRGQTPLSIFILDQRDGDLGRYLEFGLAFFVAPRHEPGAMPGWYIKTSPVNDAFSCEAGSDLWGYRKTTEYALRLNKDKPDSVCFTLSKGSSPVLTVSFPRGGSGSSTAIPWYTYTVRKGKPYRTIFTRTGRGERIRAGGDGVKLVPGSATEHAYDSLWKLVHELGLAEQSQPFLHSWTEYMSGEFGSPVPLQ